MIDYAEFEADDGLTYTGHLFNPSPASPRRRARHSGGGIAYAIHGTDGAGYNVTSFGIQRLTGQALTRQTTGYAPTPSVDFEATQVTGEGFQLSVDGTIASLSAVQAVVFSDLLAVDHLGRPEGCLREPSGAVAVLTNDGHWFDPGVRGHRVRW